MITHSLEVLIGRDNPEKNIAIKCHDSGVCLKVYLKQEVRRSKWRATEEAYTIPAGASAVLKVEKLDKKYVLQKGKCQGSAALFELDPQALTVVGKNPAEVNIYGKDGRRITTATFYIEVLKELGDGCTEDSETYVDVLNEQIQRAEDAAKRSEEAAISSHGATFTPHVSEDGTLSWTNDKGLENPEPVNIKGYTPQKGTDYFTQADIDKIVNGVLAQFFDVSEVGM